MVDIGDAIKYGLLAERMPPALPRMSHEQLRDYTIKHYNCPECGVGPGVWCRKVPGSADKTVYHGKRWGQRHRTNPHDARHAKRILVEGS